MEARFASEEETNEYSTVSLKTKREFVLLPTYIDRRTSEIKIGKVPQEIDVVSLMAAVLLNLDNRVTILQDTRLHQQN